MSCSLAVWVTARKANELPSSSGWPVRVNLPPGLKDEQRLPPRTVSYPTSSSSMRTPARAVPAPVAVYPPGYSNSSNVATPGSGTTVSVEASRSVAGVMKW